MYNSPFVPTGCSAWQVTPCSIGLLGAAHLEPNARERDAEADQDAIQQETHGDEQAVDNEGQRKEEGAQTRSQRVEEGEQAGQAEGGDDKVERAAELEQQRGDLVDQHRNGDGLPLGLGRRRELLDLVRGRVDERRDLLHPAVDGGLRGRLGQDIGARGEGGDGGVLGNLVSERQPRREGGRPTDGARLSLDVVDEVGEDAGLDRVILPLDDDSSGLGRRVGEDGGEKPEDGEEGHERELHLGWRVCLFLKITETIGTQRLCFRRVVGLA